MHYQRVLIPRRFLFKQKISFGRQHWCMPEPSGRKEKGYCSDTLTKSKNYGIELLPEKGLQKPAASEV